MSQAGRTRYFARSATRARSARRAEEKNKAPVRSPLFLLFRPLPPTSTNCPRWCQKNQSKHDPLSRENCHLSGAKRLHCSRNEEFHGFANSYQSYGPINSFNSLCRFSKKPFLQNSSSIPIFSVTQRQECKGVQLSKLLSEYGIFAQDDSSLSGRSCPKCARRILTSCKTLQEVK